MIASARRREAIESIRPYVQRAESFSGWSFPALVVRPLEPSVPWSYEERANELLHTASVVLDMGTGGGELFADMLQGYRGRAVATESWATNVPVAARYLASTGAALVRSHSLRLPFRDDTFANPEGLIAFICEQGSAARVRPDMKLVLFDDWERPQDRLKGAAAILRRLVAIAERAKAA